MHFKTSSAICFNLDQSKILSSGNGLSLCQDTHHNKDCPCSHCRLRSVCAKHAVWYPFYIVCLSWKICNKAIWQYFLPGSNPLPHNPDFWQPWKRSLLKIVCKMEKMLVRKVKAVGKRVVMGEEGGWIRLFENSPICQTSFASVTINFFLRNITTRMIQHLQSLCLNLPLSALFL